MRWIWKLLKNIFKTPQTVNYPAKPLPELPQNRGLIEYGEPHCIYCLKCEKSCPPGAILFVPTPNPSSNEYNKKKLKYEYNPWLCIYCGECVRACPKPQEALWQTSKKPKIGLKSHRVNEAWFEKERAK